MENSPALDYFITTRKDLADGMNNVSYLEYEWGNHFVWKDLDLPTSNLLIINNVTQVNETGIEDLLDTTSVSKTDLREHRLLSPNGKIDGLIKSEQLVFMKKEKGNVKAPFLPDFNIRKFSFDIKELKIDGRKMTGALSLMLTSDRSKAAQIERFIGGVLHMMNGVIWTLEDHEENIIGAILYGSTDSENYVRLELMGIISQYRESNLLSQLLKSTLESYKDLPVYTEILSLGSNFPILEENGFQKEIVLDLYTVE